MYPRNIECLRITMESVSCFEFAKVSLNACFMRVLCILNRIYYVIRGTRTQWGVSWRFMADLRKLKQLHGVVFKTVMSYEIKWRLSGEFHDVVSSFMASQWGVSWRCFQDYHVI